MQALDAPEILHPSHGSIDASALFSHRLISVDGQLAPARFHGVFDETGCDCDAGRDVME